MVAVLEKISMGEGCGLTADYISDTGGIWHFHPEYELVLHLKSNGTRIVGDSIELFDRYDLVLIGDNLPHSWNYYQRSSQLPDKHGIVVRFKKETFGKEILSLFEMQGVRELLEQAQRGICFSMGDAMKVEKSMINMVHSSGIDKIIDFYTILGVLCKSTHRSVLCSENYKKDFDDRGNKKMADVYSYIQENYHKRVSLAKIAKVARMNKMSFSRYFKKNAGASFVEYLNKVRINKACYLLRETEYNINTISKECGFTSISNFNKTFKRVESISPREYRENYL